MPFHDEHLAKKDHVEGTYPLENRQLTEGHEIPPILNSVRNLSSPLPQITGNHSNAELPEVGLDLGPVNP
jgi:hypothetical protein